MIDNSVFAHLPSDVQWLLIHTFDNKSLINFCSTSTQFRQLFGEYIEKKPELFSSIFKTKILPQTPIIPEIFRKISIVDLSKYQPLNNELLTQILDQLSHVEELSIAETSVDSFLPLHPQKNHLKTLNISYCTYLNLESSEILRQFPNLSTIIQERIPWTKATTALAQRALDLRGSSSEIDVSQLARSLEKLTLAESNTKKLTNLPPNLVELDLSCCWELENDTFSEVSKLSNLKILNLKKNRNIKSLDWLKDLPYLSTVDISYTDASELPLLNKVEDLTMVNTKFDSWDKLLSYSNLKKLDVSNCIMNVEKNRVLENLKSRFVHILGEGKSLRRTWS